MNPELKKRLQVAAAGGTLAIAEVLMVWFEGTRYTPYRDPVGVLTVCEGITHGVLPGKTYTEAECAALRKKANAENYAAVKRQIKPQLSMWATASLMDFVHNLGETALKKSTMRKHFNAGRIEEGCSELIKWQKARIDGQLVSLPGLVTRREVEEQLCKDGEPK